MPRLYIRNKPVECELDPGVNDNVFYMSADIFWRHGVDYKNYWHRSYLVAFVRDGVCWSAVNMRIMANKQLRVECIECDDQTIRQHILLTDMIID